MTHDGMPKHIEGFQNTANIVLIGIFALEVLLKILGLGPWGFMSDS